MVGVSQFPKLNDFQPNTTAERMKFGLEMQNEMKHRNSRRFHSYLL